MRPSPHGETVLVPKHRSTTIADRATTGLPPDLLNRAASRLQTMTWLYAFTFFMSAFFPSLLFPEERGMVFGHVMNWAPGVISIAVAVAVAVALRMARLRPSTVIVLALVFEVVSSYGIAAAELLHPIGLDLGPPWIGLSWVAVWVLILNVVVPTVPKYAVIAALASATSVPAMLLVSINTVPPIKPLAPVTIFFSFVFPYVLVVIMAYVGARVVYSLGAEVSRARELGSYRLEDRLGAGGMGEVWRASHRLLARPAAIKLIRTPAPGTAAGISDDQRKRFEREAQVIAQLRSPHTVTLFDFGVADEGTFYYVMELLDGVDAETLVRRFGPLPPERVVHVLRQMCHSLAEAGARGLVHRDIKPANIFLCRYGEDLDFVKVLDFGIAKAAHGPSAQSQTLLTNPHMIQGTPAFMAPEQALGDMDVDARADIYATGCVAYWLLTGHLVFTGETPIKVLLAHTQAPPEPPSSRTEIVVPPELDTLILDCLSKDRGARPQSARDLLARLDAVPTSSAWTDARARQWWAVNLPQ
jgi:hypothetical protein